MQRNFIIIGGGFLQLPLIETASAMGLHTLVFDMASKAPGALLAKQQVLMSTRDIEGCVREARRLSENLPIHGVMTAGTDASRAVAAIASALELPGIRYADAEAASNKVLMRLRLKEHALPIPDFRSVWSLNEVRAAMDQLSFPLVLKPAENMGARGVIKIERRQDIYRAFRHTKKYSPTGEMILEEYMSGAELSVDSLSWEGKFRVTGIADRIIAHEPFFIELGHNMPSAQPEKILQEAEELMQKASQALGIHTGAAKGDLKITPEGIKIGEIAARLSGGFMSSHTYPLHSGVNVFKAAIKIALGETEGLEEILETKSGFVAIERGIVCPPAKILKLRGVEKISASKNIEFVHMSRKEGEIVPPLTSNLDKVGHVIAKAKNLTQAEEAIESALQNLELELDETYGVDWEAVEAEARRRFSDQVCWVCRLCDGSNCASGVPGMGGVGKMESFRDNSRALAELQILPRYIREEVEVDSSLELFGRKFEYPIMAAPMTGVLSNMNGVFSDEYEFARMMLQACKGNGSIAWLGDGASPDKYLSILKALKETQGFGILICKPRADKAAIEKRFRLAKEIGLLALGMDIDALSFKTMQLRKQATLARNAEELKEIRDMSPLPFILKGIMSVADAEAALEIGADAIVVSNHGGRVLDEMPGTARVLPEIVRAVGKEIPVLADGGVRSGQDAFKFLALGAKAVLVGRPAAIALVGGREKALQYLFSNYASELRKTMQLCGLSELSEIDSSYLLARHTDRHSYKRP